VNRSFDFYEYAGVIIPGAVLILGLLLLFPDGHVLFTKDGVTFGELGLFVIMAYAAGHLIQGIGNYIQWIWWKLSGGMPSKRLLGGHYLSAEQRKRLIEALKKDPRISRDISTCDKAEYTAIVREVYSVISGAGKAARIDTFNGNYGLLRGLAAAFLTLIIVAVVVSKGPVIIGVLIILLLLALQRMHRFAAHYAIELFTQYLLLKQSEHVTGDGKG
jgi:hypothetical protein